MRCVSSLALIFPLEYIDFFSVRNQSFIYDIHEAYPSILDIFSFLVLTFHSIHYTILLNFECMNL